MTLKEKFIKLFGKLEFEKNVERVRLTEYVFAGECEEIWHDYQGYCFYTDIDYHKNHCDGHKHYDIVKQYKKHPVSKTINELAIARATRFKKLFISDLYEIYRDGHWFTINLDHFNKHMKYKRKARYCQEFSIIRQIDEICEILKHLEITHIEELLKTSSIEEVLEITKIKKLEKQMLDDLKRIPTAKTKLLKF